MFYVVLYVDLYCVNFEKAVVCVGVCACMCACECVYESVPINVIFQILFKITVVSFQLYCVCMQVLQL